MIPLSTNVVDDVGEASIDIGRACVVEVSEHTHTGPHCNEQIYGIIEGEASGFAAYVFFADRVFSPHQLLENDELAHIPSIFHCI
jgi:hypothetical protein